MMLHFLLTLKSKEKGAIVKKKMSLFLILLISFSRYYYLQQNLCQVKNSILKNLILFASSEEIKIPVAKEKKKISNKSFKTSEFFADFCGLMDDKNKRFFLDGVY